MTADAPGPARSGTPVAPAAVGVVGALIAVLVLAVGVIGIRDGVTAAGWMSGTSWTAAAAQQIDGLTFSPRMIPVGVIALVAGVVLLVIALTPRRPIAVAVTAGTSVWIAPKTIAHIAGDAARSVPEVLFVTATATRRTVTIRADITGGDRSVVRDSITARVVDALAPLQKTPKVNVHTKIGAQS